MQYAQVIVDVAHAQVDRTFTYRVPEGFRVQRGDRVSVPFGPRTVEGYVISSGDDDGGVDPCRMRDIKSVLDDIPALLPELIDLALWMRGRYHCLLVDALRLLIPAQMREGRVKPLMLLAARSLVPKEDYEQALSSLVRAPKQRMMLERLAAEPRPVMVASLPAGSPAVLRAMEKKGLVALEKVEVARRPAVDALVAANIVPTARQREAIDAIAGSMDKGGGFFLLHGVTGSGKTEVYIAAIRRAIAAGGSAIVLVPEIALTPQMVGWFRARFGDSAAVLHSRLSSGERYDEWRRIRMGGAQVVVGARSAAFAPLENLKLIVVDEEHEHTYQSEKTPQYDAREVAAQRCRLGGASLVLGSATPSLFTYARAMRGHYELIELPDRVNGRPMPAVDVVDMRLELMRGNKSIFSGALLRALRETLDAKEQAMLLINRRGHSTFVSCRACGQPVRCEHCDITMTYHMRDDCLRCHYCDDERTPPKTCPGCGSPHIRYFGAGTQKVEDELHTHFPGVRALRMDYDTTRGKDGHRDILRAFRDGEAQVLIGTQMIAKGHDFPNVTLVGIVAADLSLNVPDYRSEERTFQLLTQMEGRAGRGRLPGRVVVQSYDPEHYAIQLAAGQDYRAFYHAEMNRRRKGLFPPYTILARLLITGPEEEKVRDAAQQLGEQFEALLSERGAREKIVQTRAMEAPLARIRDEYRWQVFCKMYAKEGEEVLELLRSLATPQRDVKVVMEIDPANML